MTRFGKTVEASMVALGGQGRLLNQAESEAVIAAVESVAQIIATSSPEVVQEIETNIRQQHGTAAWKILAWAAKDVHWNKDKG